jgi:hypothetical protein
MNGERYGQKSKTHSSRGETKDAGTLVAPKFFGRKYKKNDQPSPACVCARTDSNKIWGYNICPVCPYPVERGGEKTELNGLLSVTAGKEEEKNRIARTNTWTSLEKGGNNIKGKYDVLVYVCVCVYTSRFSVGTGKTKHAHPNRCVHIYSLSRVMQFDLVWRFF